ncbi:MAG: PAS domain S-box protein [Chloroflexi bacterium]|nr:PAS domain S-box protein [Chloroflexota bacterium]
MAGHESCARQASTAFGRWLIGVASALTVVHGGVALVWGAGPIIAVFPWYVPMMHSFLALAALSIAFLGFGRYQVRREPTPFWIGMGFGVFAVFAIFYVLSWPGLLPDDRGLIARLPNTSAWLWSLKFSGLAAALLAAVTIRWPSAGAAGGRWWLWPTVAGVAATAIVGLSLAFEELLPSLVVDGFWSSLTVGWLYALLVAFALGTGLSAHRYRRAGDSLLGYVALAELLFVFALLTVLIGGKRYDLWWYWQRFLWVGGFSAILFGLLSEYVLLYQRERETAARLHDTLGQLKALLSNMADAVFVVDADRRLFDANSAALSLTGLVREDLGRSIVELIDRLDLRHLDGSRLQPEELAGERAIGGETFTGREVRLRKPSGEERLVSFSGAPVPDEEGRVTLAVVVGRDITEERRRERARLGLARVAQKIAASASAEEALAIAASELVASFDIALARVWLWDETAQVLVLQASAGFSSRVAASGSQFGRLRLDQSPIGAIAAGRWAFSTNELLSERWLQDREQARRQRIAAFAGFPLLATDRLLGVMGVFSCRRWDQDDLIALATFADQLAIAIEKARLLAQLQVALKLREEFIAAAAHELRTPLTSLKGYVGLLQRLAGTRPAASDRLLGAIDRSVGRVARLAGELVQVADLERGTLPLRTERFDLAELAHQMVGEVQTEHPGYHFRLETTPAGVVADREQIAQTIRHLIENAIKYQSRSGDVAVAVEVVAGEAVLGVRDGGVGISPERLPYVFEPMYEPIPSGAPGYVGVVGLGLGISKRVIELHGGRIWVESEVGRGSTFHFALPLSQPGGSQAVRET